MAFQKRFLFLLFIPAMVIFLSCQYDEKSSDDDSRGLDAAIYSRNLAVGSSANSAILNFMPINEPGFEDELNRYAWSLKVFKDKLYVGTWNTDPFEETEESNGLGEYRAVSNGAEAYRYIGGTQWDRVITHGLTNPNNRGLRNMIVWDDPDDYPDKGEAIYGTTFNPTDGLEVWRTFDGDNWEVVVGPGSPYPSGFGGGPDNKSGRGMIVFKSQGKEWIYLGTMSYNGGEIWRTDDGTTWEKVTDGVTLGLGARPITMSTMCIYQETQLRKPALFIGTWGATGFFVIKSYDGVHFSVAGRNGIGHLLNVGVAKLIVFEDRMWLLGINYLEGFDIYRAKNRRVINGNSDWELVATKGLTDSTNMYAWNGIVYDNGSGPRLYIGTFNPIEGFFLYSVDNNLEWATEVGTGSPYPPGMGDYRSYGVRSFEIYSGKLVLGFACMPAPAQVWMAW